MNAGNEFSEMPKNRKPQVFFKKITFNDGNAIALKKNSIIVFTGANNCGKSQVLRDAENCFGSPTFSNRVIIADSEQEFLGEIEEETFLGEHFILNQHGNYQPLGITTAFGKDTLKTYWQEHTLHNGLHTLFVKRLGTELRLTSSNALQRNNNPEKHPLYKLNKSEALAEKISAYFRQAFGFDLIVNRNEMQTIPLHVGQAPNKKKFTIDMQDDYYSEVAKLPVLQAQGDGMRSFVSILLDAFTAEHSVTLIDEPEAFLHPPQARVLGKMLAKDSPDDRQLLISTHSEDFLQGILDADNENITVVRIDRVNDINKMSVLENNEIKKLWSNPILRYSNILSGLFHEKVVVCESDYDCLFYQAIVNSIYEYRGEIAPDILFTHCGGKNRAKDVVAALRAVNVPVVAICDFDLLNSKQTFKAIVESFGLDWETTISTDMKIIYDGMNAKNDGWSQIKKIGKAGFTGREPAAYEKVETICSRTGLFIVPVGELECFDKTVNKEKKDWVYYVLENYDLATEPKLESARKFIEEVVNYKL